MPRGIFDRKKMAAGAVPEDLLFQEVVKSPLSTGEGGVIAFSIRKDASRDEIMSTLTGACTAYKSVAGVTEQLKLVIGKTLAVIRERKLFGQYKNFERFLMAEIVDKYSISRSTAWEAIKVAQAFPEVDSNEYAAQGGMRLLAVARALPKVSDEQKPKLLDLIATGKPLPLDEVRKAVTQIVSPGKPVVHQVVIRVTADLLSEWKAWADNADVQAAAGGATADAVLAFTLRQAQKTWKPPKKMARKETAATSTAKVSA